MDEFLETVLMYKTVHRPVINSYWRTLEEIWNIGSQIELCCVVHHTGSMFEGMPDEACGDQDRLLVRSGFPEVIFEPIGVKENIPSNVVIAYNDTENPAYVLLKAVKVETLPQTVKDAVNDKGFVQSARLIEIMKQDTEQVHGPSLTALLYSSIPEIGTVDHVMFFMSFMASMCHGFFNENLISMALRLP